MLINLINNAVDAVKDLEEKWVHIELFDEESEVVLQVRDSGHGIPVDQRERLFQPFHTTKPVGEGTGLGLSIVKGIMDDHQASIKVLETSETTCFELRFAKVKIATL